MVRVLAVGVLVALAACKVGVEGAPCDVAGATQDCPEGQACGTDRKCSERAAGCAPLHWDGADCRCPPYDGAELVADAQQGSARNAAPYATGSLEPAACRFARLTDALAVAAARAPASVVAHGAPSEPAVFGADETFPLVVPENVTLRALNTGGAVIRAGATTQDLVALQGAIEGFRIDSTLATGDGIAVSCGAPGAARRVVDVTIDGGGLLASGMDVAAGSCGAFISGVTVAKADGPALQIRGDFADPRVEVVTGTFTASGSGILVTGGRIVVGVEPPRPAIGEPPPPWQAPGGVAVTGNRRDGIVLMSSESRIDASFFGVVVERNDGTGIVLEGVPPESRVGVVGCDVSANGATSGRPYGDASPQRIAGGVLVHQDVALGDGFRFDGNRVFGNAGDELAFDTTVAWSLAKFCEEGSAPDCVADNCGPDSNAFACLADDDAVAVVAGTGSVDVTTSIWPEDSFEAWQNYVSGTVTNRFGSCQSVLDGTPPLPLAEACPGL